MTTLPLLARGKRPNRKRKKNEQKQVTVEVQKIQFENYGMIKNTAWSVFSQLLRPGHTGPDNKNEKENEKNARPRLVE